MKRFWLLGAVAISLSGCVSDDPRYGDGYGRDVYRPRPVGSYRESYREPPIYRDDRGPYRDFDREARRYRFDDDRRYDRRDDGDRRYDRREDSGRDDNRPGRGEGRRSDDPGFENGGRRQPAPGRREDGSDSNGVIVNGRQPVDQQPACVQGLFNQCPGGSSPIDRGSGN